MKGKLKYLGALAALMLTGVLSPNVAAAQGLVLQEVTESMNFRGGKVTRRVAASALIGHAEKGSPLCPAELAGLAERCAVTAFGSDNVSLTTGLGSFRAQLYVIVPGDNPADGPERVVLTAQASGRIDFSPAFAPDPMPFGTVAGTITVKGGGAHRIRGVFFMPVTFNDQVGNPDTNPAFYIGLDVFGNFVFRQLTEEEYSLTVPTVRFEVLFEN